MENSQQCASEQLSDFKKWPDWLIEKGDRSPLGTPGAVQWFCRKHRKKLVASGQLILRRGPGGFWVGPKFDEVCLQIMREESAALNERAV